MLLFVLVFSTKIMVSGLGMLQHRAIRNVIAYNIVHAPMCHSHSHSHRPMFTHNTYKYIYLSIYPTINENFGNFIVSLSSWIVYATAFIPKCCSVHRSLHNVANVLQRLVLFVNYWDCVCWCVYGWCACMIALLFVCVGPRLAGTCTTNRTVCFVMGHAA